MLMDQIYKLMIHKMSIMFPLRLVDLSIFVYKWVVCMTTKIGYLSLAMFLDKRLPKRSDSQIQMMDSYRQLVYIYIFFYLITATDTCMLGNHPYSIADHCAAIPGKYPSVFPFPFNIMVNGLSSL